LRTRGTWLLVRNGLPRITHFLFKIAPPPPIPPGGGVFIIGLGGIENHSGVNEVAVTISGLV
jgi:hypothetical protein